MKAKRRGVAKPPQAQPGPLAVQVVLLSAIVSISPLLAGKLAPIPDLAVQALVFVAAIVWLVAAAKKGSIALPDRRIALLAALLMVLLLLSAVDSVSLHRTLCELLKMSSYLLVFFMVAGLRESRESVYSVLAFLAVSTMIVGAIGVKEYVLTRSPGWRTFSTFFNPDFLAGFMALMLPVALAWYLSRVSAGVSIIAALGVLFAFSGILMSGSRFGIVAAAGGVGLFLLLALVSRRMRPEQLLRLAVLIPAAAAVFLMLGKPLASRVASVKAESHSGGFRIHTWKGTARMAAAYPVNGTGLGTFEIAYPRYATVGYTKLAHNSYLQLAAEAGPSAGLVLILLLGSCTLPTAFSLAKRRQEDAQTAEPSWMPETSLMTSGLLGGAAASLARNLVDSDWYVAAIGIGFWAVLGAAAAIAQPSPRKDFDTTSSWNRLGLSGITAILLLGTLALSSMLAGELVSAAGDAQWAEGPKGALHSYQLARTLDPLNAEHCRRLSGAYLLCAEGLREPSYADYACSELRRAIRLEPTCAKGYYQLGKAYEYYPRSAEAILAFHDALECDPQSPQIMLALARRYEFTGQGAKALDMWERMIAVEESPYEKVKAVPEVVEPAYIFAHAALGRHFEREGEKASARVEYRKALERADRFQDSMSAMGAILEAGGRRNVTTEEEVRAVQEDLDMRLDALDSAHQPTGKL